MEMPFVAPRSPSRAHHAVEVLGRILSEATMGFLALVALALGVVPWLFTIGSRAAGVFAIAEWVVVGLFALEYVVQLVRAPSKKAYVRNPWRILDLGIIVLPLLSFLPSFGQTFRSSPILRLLRLVRAILFGARAGGRAVRRAERKSERAGVGSMQVSVLERGHPAPRSAPWEEFVQWASGAGSGWVHVSNLDGARLQDLARVARVPEEFLRANLGEMIRPRLEIHEDFSALFLWLPDLDKAHPPSLERTSVVLLTRPEMLVTLSHRGSDLQSAAVSALREASVPADAPFATGMTYAISWLILQRYKEVVEELESEVRGVEETPAKDGGQSFFERAFGLDRTLSQAKGDLWRLKGIFASLAAGRVRVQGSRPEDAEFLRSLSEEAESAYEETVALRESLVSLMDLHMNVASFEMNRVMRVLAILSALGLVPAVVGGLLGMNLIDNPWPATLPQVAFGVAFGMLMALYVFFAKGWIR
jgi:Mg2+ and Co2+ transporter CorA